VGKWVRRVPSVGKDSSLGYMYDFFCWLRGQRGRFEGLGVDEVLDVQAGLSGRESYELLDLGQEWVNDVLVGTYKTKKKVYGLIRSFFKHNRVPLPEDPDFIVKENYEATRMDISLDDFKAILREANLMYRSVFLTKFQGMMGTKEIIYFSSCCWPQVDTQLRKGSKWLHSPDRIIIHLPGRKGSRKGYYTSLERDAVDALRLYLRKWRGPIRAGEAIYLNDRRRPLTEYNVRQAWLSCAIKAGVVEPKTPKCEKCGGPTVRRRLSRRGAQKVMYRCTECGYERAATSEDKRVLSRNRYGKASHEGCRDLTRSRWEKSGVKGWIAEFRMGHIGRIDPNNYQRVYEKDPAWMEEQFEKAAPWLNIISENPEVVPVRDYRRLQRRYDEVENELRMEVRRLRELIERRHAMSLVRR